MNLSTLNNTQKNPADSAPINLKEILLKYLHYTWLFLLLLAITLTAAWAYLRYTIPKYSVSASLLIRNDKMNGGNLEDEMFANLGLFQSSSNKQNEIEILQSRTMMERVVKTLGLDNSYFVSGNVKTTNIYKEAPFRVKILSLNDSIQSFSLKIHFNENNSFRIEGFHQDFYFGQIVQLPYGSIKIESVESVYTTSPFRDFIFQWTPVPDQAEILGRNLTVAPANDLSNVLHLTYITETPKLGSDILNQLMTEYNEAAIEDKNQINRRILAFIDDRLGLVEKQLDSVEVDLQKFKTNREVIDLPAQSQIYFGNMSELERNIQQQEIQLQVADLLRNYLQNPSNKLSLVPSTLGLTDPTLLELVGGYNTLVSEREKQLQTGATATNPVVQNIDKDLEIARVKILTNLANIDQAYRNTLRSLAAQRGSIRNQISSIPDKEKQGRDRVRQQEIKQTLYLYLLQKKEESSIAEASTIANSRVIDNSRPKKIRVSPIPLKIYGIALILGLVIPVIVIYLLDVFNDKVTTRSDITKITNSPIVGEIGHHDGKSVLIFPDKSRSVIAEQLRILRSNLKYLLSENVDKSTLLVTSSFSGEGKSFISTNLAAAIAVSGKKTVILEFDLRKPKIATGLGISKVPGLTNYLVGGASLEELPKSVDQVENLSVIPSGPVPPNPSEILLTPKLEELFKWLSENFDIVIIDTAPVGLVSDSTTLTRFADATLYIVRQKYTYKRQLQFIQELYEGKKLPKMALVVNDVTSNGAKSYYGYGGGRYGYGYGYGYNLGGSSNGTADSKGSLIGKLKKIFTKGAT